MNHYSPRNVGSFSKDTRAWGRGSSARQVRRPWAADQVNGHGRHRGRQVQISAASAILARASPPGGWGQERRRRAQDQNTDIVNELKLPPVKIHCSVLAEDAIKAAIRDFQEKWAERQAVAAEAQK